MTPSRRDIVAAGAAGLGLGLPLLGAQASPASAHLLKHRFGVNYVPSGNWYYCWNDWRPDAIRRDFDAIARIGADHIRIMLVWPWFQPNQRWISQIHLDRMEQLLSLAAEQNLDVLITLYTGWLSGFAFKPPYLESESFYDSERWGAAQSLYLTAVAKRAVGHRNFLGFDIGNEINVCWSTSPAKGDPWMARVFAEMRQATPGRVHVNGVDHAPWFTETTFSPQALVAQQDIVALHSWSYWAGAGAYGKPLERPYTQLPAALAALSRSYGQAPEKPIWLQEFGACDLEMSSRDVAIWMERAVEGAVAEGVSWFTWWSSHDVDRRLDFHPFEYDLGLIGVDNVIKDRGRVFQQIAENYRGKSVVLPKGALPPPPTQRTQTQTWSWLLEHMAARAAS